MVRTVREMKELRNAKLKADEAYDSATGRRRPCIGKGEYTEPIRAIGWQGGMHVTNKGDVAMSGQIQDVAQAKEIIEFLKTVYELDETENVG